MKVETEEKYYCIEPEGLIKIAEDLNFQRIKNDDEIDEYFTDINSNFIRNRTCLRIRKTNSQNMEITYKGKSDSLLNLYCKLENNVRANIEDYDNYVSLFSSLGYYSYVEVVKKRLTYSLNKNDYEYSIMIDTLPEIGGFVEFEILAKQSKATKRELQQELKKFVSNFKGISLTEVTMPYRDIVAQHMKHTLLENKEINNLCINLDCELLKYEKDFFKKFKKRISEIYGSNVKWGEYKRNEKVDDKIYQLVAEYLDNLIFNSNGLLIMSKLLKQLPYKQYFFTKVNETFCECFLKKLNIKANNILYMRDNNTASTLLKQKNIFMRNTVIINNSNLKISNRQLLIMINE